MRTAGWFAAAVALFVPVDASWAATVPCRSPGSVIAANRVAVLTLLRFAPRSERIPGYYACSKGHRARYLGEPGRIVDGGIVITPDLSGRFVGLAFQRQGKGGCVGTLTTLALDSNRYVGRQIDQPIDEPCRLAVVDVQVTRGGVLFWSARLEDGTGQVFRQDRRRTRTLLDSGPNVDPASLAVIDSRGYWTSDGQPRVSAA